MTNFIPAAKAEYDDAGNVGDATYAGECVLASVEEAKRKRLEMEAKYPGLGTLALEFYSDESDEEAGLQKRLHASLLDPSNT